MRITIFRGIHGKQVHFFCFVLFFFTIIIPFNRFTLTDEF